MCVLLFARVCEDQLLLYAGDVRTCPSNGPLGVKNLLSGQRWDLMDPRKAGNKNVLCLFCRATPTNEIRCDAWPVNPYRVHR